MPVWQLIGGGVLIRKGRQVWALAGQTTGTRRLGETRSNEPIYAPRPLQGQSPSLIVTQKKGAVPGIKQRGYDHICPAHINRGPKQLQMQDESNIFDLIIPLSSYRFKSTGQSTRTPASRLSLWLFSHHGKLRVVQRFCCFFHPAVCLITPYYSHFRCFFTLHLLPYVLHPLLYIIVTAG